MSKPRSDNPNPRGKPPSTRDDAPVHGGEEASAPPVAEKTPMKRLTFDISADLHKRIRLACVQNDVDMAVEIRRLLLERFPK